MKKAFTIVEVLVVISIMGMIMGVGAVRLRDFQRKQEVVSVKRVLLTDVRAAQSDAASGRKPTGCTGTLMGYGFRVIATSPAEYETFARCTQGAGSTDYVVKNVDLPSNISLSGYTSPNPIIFKPLNQGTNMNSGSSTSITITSANTSNTESLFISASGEVK